MNSLLYDNGFPVQMETKGLSTRIFMEGVLKCGRSTRWPTNTSAL